MCSGIRNRGSILMLSGVVVAFVTALSSSDAAAEGVPPASSVHVQPPVAAPVAAVGADPNIDRGFLLPTAMTQPAGSLTYNNYELLLHGITYGVTDRLQTSLTVLPPIVSDMPFVGIAAAKGRFVATDRLNLAFQGSVGWGHQLGGSSDESVYMFGAGLFASACLRQDCSSLLSASATYQLALSSQSDQNIQYVVYGGSLVHAVSPRVKLLAEVASAAGRTSTDPALDNMPGVLAGYGVRLHGSSLAADVGFVKPFVSENDGDFILGLPFANVSYRW